LSQGNETDQRSDKEQQLAHGCRLVVVADSVFYLHRTRTIQRLAAEQLGLTEPLPQIRFDLLAIPDLLGQTKSTAAIDLLATDVATAIGLHGTESLLGIGENGSPDRLIQAVAAHPALKGRLLKTAACSVSRPALTPWSRQAVIGCMDWRLHGRGDLPARARFAFGHGRSATDLVTVPGVAKGLRTDGPRFRAVVRWLKVLRQRGLKRLFLVSHEDCGGYGGHETFDSRDEENLVLTEHLQAAAKRFGQRLPNLSISLGIAELSGDDSVSRVRRLD
jgi:hypothetical protein